ncbi:MAG: protein TolR [Deltaproteobacteria bacterium]|nr:protein TolR [Deltaproteobacteria bacterium]
MALSSHKQGRSVLAEINVTPMVDVMLVLLIIFMIAAPLLQQGIEVDIPEVSSSSATQKKPEDTVLTITQAGQIYINDDKSVSYNTVNISDKLSSIYKDTARKEIFIRADKQVPYGHVVKVMGVCKNLGIEKVGLDTEFENQGGS